MICPRCSHHHKRALGMTCSGCRYRFVFDPKLDEPPDSRFQNAIEHVSASGERVFTRNELYARLARRMVPTAVGWAVLGIIVGFVAAIAADGGLWFWLVPALAVVGYLWGRTRPSPLTLPRFEELLERWRAGNKGSLDGLIEEPALQHVPGPEVSSEVFEYGAECVIVVQHDYLVDWLVGNHAHLAHNAIIVSSKGYPPKLRERVKALLEARTEVPVYLLHDTGREGRSMRTRVLNLQWAPFANAHIIDLGLSEAHARRLKPLKRLPVKGEVIAPDMLGFGFLTGLLTVALAEQIAFAAASARTSAHAEYTDFG